MLTINSRYTDIPTYLIFRHPNIKLLILSPGNAHVSSNLPLINNSVRSHLDDLTVRLTWCPGEVDWDVFPQGMMPRMCFQSLDMFGRPKCWLKTYVYNVYIYILGKSFYLVIKVKTLDINGPKWDELPSNYE